MCVLEWHSGRLHVPVICNAVAGNSKTSFSGYICPYISCESKISVVCAYCSLSFLECPIIFSVHELYEMGPSGKRVTTIQDGDHCSGALIFDHRQRLHGGGDHFEWP